MLYTRKRLQFLPPLTIRNNFSYDVIKQVSNTRFLGVIYDDKLNFSHHINMLCNKLSRTSSLLYQLRDFLPIYILKKIYLAHVLPLINYCNCIWANTFPTHILPLVLIHKRIIRNVSKADFLEHTQPLYKNLKILNIENIRKMNLSTLMFKQLQNNENNIPIHTPLHQYNTRRRELLQIPSHRTTLISNSFYIQATRLWNQLPRHIKFSNSIQTFKKKLKTYLNTYSH